MRPGPMGIAPPSATSKVKALIEMPNTAIDRPATNCRQASATSAVSSSQLSRRKSLSAAEFRHSCNIVRRAELPPIRAVELRDQAFSWPFWTAGRRAGPFCTSPVRPGHKSLLLFTIGARNLPSGNGTSAVYSFSLRPFLGTLYGIDHPLIVQLVAALQAEGAALGQTPT